MLNRPVTVIALYVISVASSSLCFCQLVLTLPLQSVWLKAGRRKTLREHFMSLMLQHQGRLPRRLSSDNSLRVWTNESYWFRQNTVLPFSTNHSHWGLCFRPITTLLLSIHHSSLSARLLGKVLPFILCGNGCRTGSSLSSSKLVITECLEKNYFKQLLPRVHLQEPGQSVLNIL